jgi:DNA replication and repair protein RecF
LSRLNKIILTQFRNYSSASYQFQAAATCITGANGSGKTNLLDAVYYLCYTKSYFNASQQNNAQAGTDGFRVEGTFLKNDRNEVISCKWKQGKKEIMANGVEYEKVTDHIGTFSSVMIAPDDIALINDGSELRRRWVDSILSQVDSAYLDKLLRYQRILLQRNAWLKMQATAANPDYTELDYYNACMAEDGQYIFERRADFLAGFLPVLNDFYHRLSGGKEVLQVTYQSDLYQKTLAQWLQDGLQHDMRYQRTLRGIHKDDWTFMLSDMPVKQYASQGQKKSFLFALKLAQYAFLSKEMGHLPILLLDDVFEKLDQQRIEALLTIIRGPGFGQVLLTDTHEERIRQAFGEGSDIEFVRL